jgi:malate dehydrogenase (oxaloacetate-decarboxylating)(NADP+)
LVSLGAKRENVWVTDIEGVVYEGRSALMDRWKSLYAQKTSKRTLAEVIEGADIFLGLSAPGVLKPDMAKRMAKSPLIMALANPNPEITPEEALKARPDALICTGRSDYPNQVNNVLCFPYIFRGALDVGATTVNEDMTRALMMGRRARSEPARLFPIPSIRVSSSASRRRLRRPRSPPGLRRVRSPISSSIRAGLTASYSARVSS